jgi:hypothetical protein
MLQSGKHPTGKWPDLSPFDRKGRGVTVYHKVLAQSSTKLYFSCKNGRSRNKPMFHSCVTTKIVFANGQNVTPHHVLLWNQQNLAGMDHVLGSLNPIGRRNPGPFRGIAIYPQGDNGEALASTDFVSFCLRGGTGNPDIGIHLAAEGVAGNR